MLRSWGRADASDVAVPLLVAEGRAAGPADEWLRKAATWSRAGLWVAPVIVASAAWLMSAVPAEASGAADPADAASVAASLAVTVHATDDPIDEFRTGRILVSIVNTGDSPLRFEDATVLAPPPLNIAVEDVAIAGVLTAGPPMELPPHRPVTVVFVVGTEEDAQLGATAFVAQFFITASRAGDEATRVTVEVPHTVAVNVFASSELAELLKIPSLLFLPGFLMLSAFVVAARVRPVPRVDLAKTIDLYSAAVVVVVGSLALAAAYGWATGRDLRVGFSFNDVWRLALLGVAAGAILHVALLAGVVTRRARRTPSPGDDPAAVLRKLARQRLTLTRPRAMRAGQLEPPPWGLAYLYDEADAGSGKRAVGPPIAWRLRPSGDEPGDQDLESAVRSALDTDDARGLVKVMRSFPGRLQLGWDRANSRLSGIEHKPLSEIAVADTRERVVRDAADDEG